MAESPLSTVQQLLIGKAKGTEASAPPNRNLGIGGMMESMQQLSQLTPLIQPMLEKFEEIANNIQLLKRLVAYQECRRQFVQCDGTAQTYVVSMPDARTAYVDNTQNANPVTITVDGGLHFIVAANVGMVIPIPLVEQFTTDKACTVLVCNQVLTLS